ncbi:MAG: hypothetical protein WBW88_18795, partial [Rhodothermales bacterium]
PEMSKPYPEIFGLVAIDQVLKGSPLEQTPGVIKVAGLGTVGMTADDLPQGEFIIFLMNHALQRAEGGRPESPDPDDQYHYERPNGYQAVLPDIGGKVSVIQGPPGWEDALGPFPSGLDGRLHLHTRKNLRDRRLLWPFV